MTIAHTLGMSVTGEGVERREQFDILDDLRCDQTQSFYISRAVPVAEFERFYLRFRHIATVEPPRRPAQKISDLSERIPLRKSSMLP